MDAGLAAVSASASAAQSASSASANSSSVKVVRLEAPPEAEGKVASIMASGAEDSGIAPETGVWRSGCRGGVAWELVATVGAGIAGDLEKKV